MLIFSVTFLSFLFALKYTVIGRKPYIHIVYRINDFTKLGSKCHFADII
jgi:hypothetical protein